VGSRKQITVRKELSVAVATVAKPM